MTKFVRRWECGICGHRVIADFETGLISCEAPSGCQSIAIPQWVLIDAYSRRKWLGKMWMQINEGEKT